MQSRRIKVLPDVAIQSLLYTLLVATHHCVSVDCRSAGQRTASCGTTPIPPKLSNNRIVGGTSAIKGSWPWQVQIKYATTSQYCGGTLISDEWVLTAAHCLENTHFGIVQLRLLSAHVGSYLTDTVDNVEQIHEIEEKVVHPRYSIYGNAYDIALLRLATAVTRNDYVQPACLPGSTGKPEVNTMCYVTGHGETAGTPFSDRLKQATVPVVSQTTCSLMYPGQITSHMLCAGYLSGGHDTCQGDSGGPLVSQYPYSDGDGSAWTVYGVTSFGNGCAQSWATGVYTNVAHFTEWIEQEMAARQ